MPLQGAPLAEYCGGPTSLCNSVELDCGRCPSVNKEDAEARRRAGNTIIKELQNLRRGGQE